MQKSLSSSKQKSFLGLLRQVREEAGLRQVDVAERLNQPQSFVSKYEAGERRLDLLELELVCEACGTELEAFVRRYRATSS
ncbi:MAG: helix-turn-helix transcriptional regulator [Rhodothermales bacterium]|nr:helix-turn-helix transcriptional regulator [Rhodothermales bacterium]